MPFVLDAYLKRIGHDGPRQATLRVLCEMHGLHPATIPFANLDPLLMRLRVDLPEGPHIADVGFGGQQEIGRP